MTEDVKNDGPSGIGGWLILLAIGVVISPLRLLAEYSLMMEQAGGFMAIVDALSAYPAAQILIWVEAIANYVLVGAFIYVAVLFFRKKKQFPLYYQILLVANLAFVLVDAVIGGIILDVPIFDIDTVKTLFSGTVAAAIWIPYVRMSKRVRNTFIR